MSVLSLVFGEKRKSQIGVVQMDATLSEVHTSEADVTEHPVEEGANITDHIRRLPEAVEINGIVSNTPIVFLASLTAESPLENDVTPVTDRAGAAYDELIRIKDQGELVTVVTTLRDYENMALTSVVVNRDAQSGNVMNAQLSLREIIIAKTKDVEAATPEVDANQVPLDQGTQTAGAASAATTAANQQEVSVVASLLGG